jgi:molybdopterin synthase sulfur carrier subunit
MPSVSVRYFASLREQAGKSHEKIETPSLTAGELYGALLEQYGFSLSSDQVKVAVNEEYRTMDHVLAAGDEIVFIPPVSGG